LQRTFCLWDIPKLARKVSNSLPKGGRRIKKGVTIPSQIRYVLYFARYCHLKRNRLPTPYKTTLFLQGIIFHGIPKGADESLFFIIATPYSNPQKDKLNSLKHLKVEPFIDKSVKKVYWDLSKFLIPVEDDVQMVFFQKTRLGQAKLFQVWFNTRWQDLTRPTPESDPCLLVPKSMLDKACKDTKHKQFDEGFALQLDFTDTAMSGLVKEMELRGEQVKVGSSSAS